MSEGDFLSRWSRRKVAARAGRPEAEPAAVPAIPANVSEPLGPPVSATSIAPTPAPPLPPVESLTPESDFTPFMQPNVDHALRRSALKALFQDQRFNVMDGLDVYIDDYSKPDPLPEGWLEKMNQVAHLGDHRPPPGPDSAPETPVAVAADPGSPGESAAEPQADTSAEAGLKQDSASAASEPHSRS